MIITKNLKIALSICKYIAYLTTQNYWKYAEKSTTQVNKKKIDLIKVRLYGYDVDKKFKDHL